MKISMCNVNPYFEKNLGQLPSNIEYKVKVNGYIAFLTQDKVIVSLFSNIKNYYNVFYMKLENKNKKVNIQGKNKQVGIVNYFQGNDKSKWITDIPTYSKIKYEEIYENIDLYYYINDRSLEYDFVLSQGANPDDICISFEGLDNIEQDSDKNIVLSIGDTKAVLLKPDVYQIIDNERVCVESEYILDENNCISFLVKEYKKEYELVLDPLLKLDYSTFLGGYGIDVGTGIDLDCDKNVYITGYSGTGGYPVTPGAYQTSYGKGCDAFVTKVSMDGSELIYSTYIGGEYVDQANSIVVDDVGCAYITGQTMEEYTTTGQTLRAYPTTYGAYQTAYGGGKYDVFVTKLNEFGNSLVYSTYIGGAGDDYGRGISLDNNGYAYVTGYTTGHYPTTTGVVQPTYGGGGCDAFVVKISQDGGTLIYSTYLGGGGNDYVSGIEVDNSGCAYIVGDTNGIFPTTLGAFQTVNKGGNDAFLAKLSADGRTLMYSTYLGGDSDDVAHGVTIDSEGYAYVVGSTQSINFPTVNPYQYSIAGGDDVFVSKVSKDGSSLIYSTYIGGSSTDVGYSVDVDNLGYAYIVGSTSSSNYPTKDAYQYSAPGGVSDIFVSKLSIDGSELVYSTYIGGYYKNYGNDGRGIVVDDIGCAYITGDSAGNYPTTPGAYQPAFPQHGTEAVVVTKLLYAAYDLSWSSKPEKVKLLDKVSTKFTLKNLSEINYDINIKYNTLDGSVTYVPDSLIIQDVNRVEDEIPPNIYLSNIPPQQTVEVCLDLVYNQEKFPKQISMTIEFELYKNIDGITNLLDTISETYYICTTVGPNYIPGCNKLLYNLEIDGKIQSTLSGIPIIYYKSENSYIYIEPSEEKYEYKVLSNLSNVVEYPINI